MTPADSSTRWLTALAVGTAFSAWWYLFAFHGVTDIGYLAHKQDPSAFRWLWGRWIVDWHQTHYALNFLAVPTAIWLAWRRRVRVLEAPPQVFWPALLLVLAALAIHVFGAKAQQTRLSLLAMALLWWAVPSFAWGRAALRGLAYPALVLLLAMPLNFFDQLLNPIRVVAVRISAAIASGIGLGVHAIGSVLVEGENRAWSIDLADSTSSVYALFTCILLTVIIAEFLHLTTSRRLLFIASSPIAFTLATIMRGVTLGLLAEFATPEAATRIDQRHPALVLAPWFLIFLWMNFRLVRLNRSDIRRRLNALLQPAGNPTTTRDREGLP